MPDVIDAFGLSATTTKQPHVIDAFGLGTRKPVGGPGNESVGDRIRHGIDHMRSAGTSALMGAGSFVGSWAGKAGEALGAAEQTGARGVMSIAHDALTPEKVDTPTALKNVWNSMRDPGAQPKIEGNALSGIAHALERAGNGNPNVKAIADELRVSKRTGLGDRLGNLARTTIADMGADPATYVPGADVLSVASKGFGALRKIPAVVRGTQAVGDEIEKIPHVSPFVDRPLRQHATTKTADTVQGVEIRHATESAHEADEHDALLEAHRTVLDAEGDRVAKAHEAARRGHEPDVDSLVVQLPPKIRAALQRDAWLNGTSDVRKKVLADGFDPAAHNVQNAPLLNIQTAYRSNYDPQTMLQELGSLTPGQNKIVNSTPGFNLAQNARGAETSLTDRIKQRLELGRRLRDDAGSRAAVFAELGARGDRPTTVLLEHALTDARAAGDTRRAKELELRLGRRTADQAAYDQQFDALWSPRGMERRLPQQLPFGQTVDDKAAILEKAQASFKHAPLTPEQHRVAAIAMHAEKGQVLLPAVIADRLLTTDQARVGSNILKGMSDAGRRSVFAIPYTHMKNIGTLQYEGPGGAAAFGRGAQIFADMKRGQTYAAQIKSLEDRGASSHFRDVPFVKESSGASVLTRVGNAYNRALAGGSKWANSDLWNWDGAQRIALDEHLMTHDPHYAQLSGYEQGAVINSVLFNYYHQSPMAKSLRAWGAPFPHWTIGNMARQGQQLATDPRRMAVMSNVTRLVNQNLFPRGTGYTLSPNDPVAEAAKTTLDVDTSYGKTLQNKGGALIGTTIGNFRSGNNVQAALLPDSLRDDAQGLMGAYFPGGTIGPQFVEGIGEVTGGQNSPLAKVGEFFGADRFKSQSPALARAAASLVGMSFKGDPSPFAERKRELMNAFPDMPAGWYKYRH